MWLAEGSERVAPFAKASVATHTLRIRDADYVDPCKNPSIIQSRKAGRALSYPLTLEKLTVVVGNVRERKQHLKSNGKLHATGVDYFGTMRLCRLGAATASKMPGSTPLARYLPGPGHDLEEDLAYH